jgi:uncharacterized C2H2 Zn-finger protein
MVILSVPLPAANEPLSHPEKRARWIDLFPEPVCGRKRNIYLTALHSLPVSSARCPKCGSGRLKEVGENHYLCEYCGHEFYACPICGEAFAHQRQLAAHTKKHRGLEEREILEELKALRELLEEVLAGQKVILAKLDRVLDAQKEVLERLDRVLELLSAKPAPAAQEPSDEELPDFLKGNPWLRMLGERTGGE